MRCALPIIYRVGASIPSFTACISYNKEGIPLSPKQIDFKIRETITAWETLRPDKSFGGMTLTQFKAVVAPSLTYRTTLRTLADQVQAATGSRDDADQESLAAIQRVVKGVVGDVTEGDNGELYKALGYVRKSDRKSGLHRRAGAAVPDPAKKAA